MTDPSGKRIRYKNIFLILAAFILTAAAFVFSPAVNRLLSQKLSSDPSTSTQLKEALYWSPQAGRAVSCSLCPRQCLIGQGQKGFCRARKNIGGKLYSLTYGMPVALHLDPIEKKPFFHVYPGTKSFSIAAAGCNLRCKFCQNWEISQLDPEAAKVSFVTPEELLRQAKEAGAKTIAFTYTEPTVFYEYMLETAKLAKEQGIACVMHSSGFINPQPLRELAKYLTAADIDLKGFSNEFYQTFCSGSLQEVLKSLQILKEEGVWLEVTNLIIPTANDSPEEIRRLCLWIKDNLGVDTPVHFSRFFPMYMLADLSPTPLETLLTARQIAKENGLHYVYVGNAATDEGEDTVCPVCAKTLIKRQGYFILENNLVRDKCRFCGAKIAGVWN